MTFETWLMTFWAEKINVGEDTLLDDDMPDGFDDWLSEADLDDLLGYGDIYGLEMESKGYKECVQDTNETLKRIASKEYDE